jgi:hypothetical protein
MKVGCSFPLTDFWPLARYECTNLIGLSSKFHRYRVPGAHTDRDCKFCGGPNPYLRTIRLTALRFESSEWTKNLNLPRFNSDVCRTLSSRCRGYNHGLYSPGRDTWVHKDKPTNVHIFSVLVFTVHGFANSYPRYSLRKDLSISSLD